MTTLWSWLDLPDTLSDPAELEEMPQIHVMSRMATSVRHVDIV